MNFGITMYMNWKLECFFYSHFYMSIVVAAMLWALILFQLILRNRIHSMAKKKSLFILSIYLCWLLFFSLFSSFSLYVFIFCSFFSRFYEFKTRYRFASNWHEIPNYIVLIRYWCSAYRKRFFHVLFLFSHFEHKRALFLCAIFLVLRDAAVTDYNYHCCGCC